MIYDRRRGIWYEENLSPTEMNERAKRIRNILRMQDKKIEQERLDKERRGYCPTCRLLLPVSGKCFCGYQKPVERKQSTKPVEVKGFVNPAILAMYN